MSSGNNNLQYVSLLAKPSSVNSSNEHNTTLVITPTIFDITAMENMHSLFHASFKHFFKWITTNFPRLTHLKSYGDLIYLLTHTSIEYCYLKAYNSLFSEYFYGLKRYNITRNSQRVLSIILSIVVPYLKVKLDDFYEELEKTDDESSLNNDLRSLRMKNCLTFFKKIKILLKKLTLKYYPYLHSAWSLYLWYYRFKFMIGSSHFNSPLLSLINLRLVYDSKTSDESMHSTLLEKFLKVSNHCFTSFFFLLQFLQWHQDYNESQSYVLDPSEQSFMSLILPKDATNNSNENAIIPPPQLPDKLANSKALKSIKENNLCPLCTKKRTNDCVLSVSGFVFCYKCLFRFVKEHQRCPLTNFPCNVNNIIRIYDSVE